MLGVLEAVDDAERRGDAAGAMELMAAHLTDSAGRIFWNPHRMCRLLQLVQLGPALPRWATSRWILEQALIQLDPAVRGARAEAMRIAVELRGGPHALDGLDEIDARTKVMDHDWVHRQLVLYEYGGLERFLDAWATSDLLAGADRIRDWVRAPLRPLRLEARSPSVLQWTDVGTGEQLELPNLGAAVLDEPGEHVLARVVPTEGGPMFDGVPLGVAEGTARDVATEPSAWLDALRAVAGTEDYFVDLVHGNFLVTDVPSRIGLLALVDVLPPDRRHDLDDEDLAEAVVTLARRTATSTPPPGQVLDPWPCVAALLLAPEFLPQVARLVERCDADWLAVLADRLPEPADHVCRTLLVDLDDAA